MNEHPFLDPAPWPLVLASKSPRRADILRAQGLEFRVEPSALDELAQPGEGPGAQVERLALEKARAVTARAQDALVLGSDTVVVVDGEILGKPIDPADARTMLGRLSGRAHEVYSSIALVCPTGEAVGHAVTRVWFRELGPAEIKRYVASGEPMDKAGAYGIQDQGALVVDRIEGCYFNVMGLPLQVLRQVWGELVPARADASDAAGS